ncbi:MAG: hypothetical protein J1F07_08945 [Muribaculaceae bacterium]|nr:hypothetical protein [Muribaculaceae bacterium]
MKAKDIISPRSASAGSLPQRNVSAETALVDVLPRLLDTADRRLGVTEGDSLLGIIDEASLLEGLGRLIAPRDDSSTVTLRVSPSAYSASQIAHAVEDADVHLVDLWSAPGEGDMLTVTLRVRTSDPSGVTSSLERYGFDVVEASGETNRNMETAMERILSLNTLLGV